jgi:hypothetical protein
MLVPRLLRTPDWLWGGRLTTPSARGSYCAIVVVAPFVVFGLLGVTWAESPQEEINALKERIESLQKVITEQDKKIQALEKRQPQAPPPAAPPAAGADVTVPASPLTHRPALADEQVSAPRPDDEAVDPRLRGFVSIPNTNVLIKFNAKPRVDFTFDPENTGDDNRFVPAKIPVTGDPTAGGRPVFNINSKGSRLSTDVRAPTIPGTPRFYFENDFFGSGSAEFNFRVRHLYGQIYNIVVGQTVGVFDDPDIWPDTVDYKGPNAMILDRIPLLHYQLLMADEWLLTFGVEQPQSAPASYFGDPVDPVNHAPDGGFNLRWENAGIGHVQFAAVFRDIGARSATLGDHAAFGWGTNLSAAFDVFTKDSVLGRTTFGEGIGSLGNDTGTFDTDAAFDSHGHLAALPYVGVFAGYTHTWAETWRSTATYGFVNMEPQASQGPDGYRRTHYASVNLIWQIRKRLSIGAEFLYGHKETQSGATGDAARTQVGVLYSIF